jgi:hypothetical protein
MSANNLDTQINNFLKRKYATFPELAISGRSDSRTVKYASKLRASGQILMAR